MTEVLMAINSYLRGSTTPLPALQYASLGYLTPFFRFILRFPSYAGTAPKFHKSERNFYNTTKLGPRPTKGAEVGRLIAFLSSGEGWIHGVILAWP